MFKLSITTSNAAFEYPNRNAEIARILHSLANTLSNRPATDYAPVRLYDFNGNAVGTVTDNGK